MKAFFIKMKSFFSPLALLVGAMMLVPYIFLGKEWDAFATLICIASIILVIVIITGYLFERKNKKD